MYSGPSFTNPTHGYGTPLPAGEPEQDDVFGLENSPEQEANWAGDGFEQPCEGE